MSVESSRVEGGESSKQQDVDEDDGKKWLLQYSCVMHSRKRKKLSVDTIRITSIKLRFYYLGAPPKKKRKVTSKGEKAINRAQSAFIEYQQQAEERWEKQEEQRWKRECEMEEKRRESMSYDYLQC